MTKMVYILCDDHEQAIAAFSDMLGWVDVVEPGLELEINEYANLIRDHESDVDYYFIDHKFFGLGWIDCNVDRDDVIDIYEFFTEDMLAQALERDPTFYFTSVPLIFA